MMIWWRLWQRRRRLPYCKHKPNNWPVIYCNCTRLWLYISSSSQWSMIYNKAYRQRWIITSDHSAPRRSLSRRFQLHRIASITRFIMYLPYRSVPQGTSRRSCSGRRYNSLSSNVTRCRWHSHICFVVRSTTAPLAAETNYQRRSCNRYTRAERPTRRTGRQMRKAGRSTPPATVMTATMQETSPRRSCRCSRGRVSKRARYPPLASSYH